MAAPTQLRLIRVPGRPVDSTISEMLPVLVPPRYAPIVPETPMPGRVLARCMLSNDVTSSGGIDAIMVADIPPSVDDPPAVPWPRRFGDDQEKPRRGLMPTSRGMKSVRRPKAASTAG